MPERFTVVRSRMRPCGYSIQHAPPVPDWVTGPGGTFGWYKLKSDALAHASKLNRYTQAKPRTGKKRRRG